MHRGGILAALALGAIAALGPSCGKSGADARGESDPAAPAPANVRVATVQTGVLRDRWVFLGEARPMAQADLAAGADAEVVEVNVRVGDRVAEGDELVRLDPSLARARMAAARASRSETATELEQARRDSQRAERLGQTVLPAAEIERDQTRVQTLDARADRLRASEREARAQLSRHRVLAPFDGVISARLVDPGDWVSPGAPVVSLIDDEQVEIIVAGSAELVQRVEVGTTAIVRHRGHEVPAKLVGIVRALDPQTRTARIRLLPETPSSWLLPGISLDVSFEVERDEEGVLVPRDALVYGAVGTRVVRVSDGKADPVPVEVIATADEQALVFAEGLAKGDTVVIRGNERLRPGQPVSIIGDTGIAGAKP